VDAPDPQTPQVTKAREVTGLLKDWRQGDGAALERLVPLVYDELRRVARGQLRREPAGHSLQATALVHEVYLRLVNVDQMSIGGRAHFLAVAARLMRQILVDHARRKRSTKRGGDVTIVSIEQAAAAAEPAVVDILALDQALDELASFDARQRDLVELKFFAGLTIDEAATALGVSAATVEREWAIAKAWLRHRLSSSPS
jgi:RNA polymerase sigma factor (TIGR02999 family)